jgi:hypothetical protein
MNCSSITEEYGFSVYDHHALCRIENSLCAPHVKFEDKLPRTDVQYYLDDYFSVLMYNS